MEISRPRPLWRSPCLQSFESNTTNSLPSRDDRDAALRSRFGAQVSIIEWDAPEDPLELFAALRTTVFDNRAVAVEIDSDDRTLTAALGLAAAMAVVPSNRIPILLPCYSDGNSGVSPIYDVVDSGESHMYVPDDAQFKGFAQVYSTVAVAGSITSM